MNKKLIVLLTLPIIILLCVSIYWAIASSIGTDVKIVIRGYDPRDLLSGHYISYTIDWDKTDCSQFTDNICPKDEFCHGFDCKFYIPETDAEQLDRLLNLSNNTFHIVYKYNPHRQPSAKELLIDDKPWQEFMKNN